MIIVVPIYVVVLTTMGSMIGEETHWLDVFFWEEDSHTFCIACSNGSMRGDMATTAKHLFLYEVGHEFDGMPYGDDFLSITYGMVWASLIHNVGEDISRDLVFILPLEGNINVAQDHKTLHTYHKWRGRKHGVSYFVYQVQIFSPPILHELKVEEHF